MSSDLTPVRKNIIGRRLFWRVSLVSLIALVALLGAMLLVWQVTAQSVYERLHATRSEAVEIFAEFLGRAADDLWATGDALGVQGDPDLLFRRALLRQEHRFFELLWVRADGKVLAARGQSSLPPLTDVPEQPWLETVQQGNLYIGEVDYAAYGVPLLDIAVPVWDIEQNFAGALVGRVDLTSLWERAVSLRVGETGHVYVAAASGAVLLHRDTELMQQQTALLPPADLRQLAAARALIYKEIGGQPVVVTGAALTTVPWYIVVQQPTVEAFLPFLQQIALPLLSVCVIIILVINTLRFTQREIVTPLRILHTGVSDLEHDLTQHIQLAAQGEFAALADALNNLAAHLSQTITSLEQRVDERTRGLLAAAEVSRSTTSVLDPDALLRQTVNLVRDHFDLYYVGLFLVDEPREYVILRAGTGEAGQQMLAAGHRFPVGASTMIAQCVTTGRARIALDVGEEAQRFDNPLLPRTRSEMALPLRSQRRVIGAMTVQSEREAAFDETNILALQTMADQVAAAIDNAHLYARTQETLHEMELLQQRYLGQAWAEFLHRRPLWGYRKTAEGLTPLGQELLAGVQQAMAERRTLIQTPATSSAPTSQVVVPLRFRDQLLGALGFAVGAGEPLSDEQVAFVEAVAEQFGLAAENLRLVEATQRIAAREHMVGDVAARIRESLDMDTVLRAAAEQIRLAMQTPEVTIRLRMTEATDENSA